MRHRESRFKPLRQLQKPYSETPQITCDPQNFPAGFLAGREMRLARVCGCFTRSRMGDDAN
jgi:hypothetical protein